MVMVSKCTLVPRLAPVRFTDKTEIQENRNSGLLVLTCFVCSSLSLLIKYPKLQFMSFWRKEVLYSARVLLAGHCFPLQLTCSTEKAIIGNTLLWKWAASPACKKGYLTSDKKVSERNFKRDWAACDAINSFFSIAWSLKRYRNHFMTVDVKDKRKDNCRILTEFSAAWSLSHSTFINVFSNTL